MRVFVASLATETNTFSPLFADRRAFSLIAASIHYLDTGEPYPADVSKIPYRKARRPLAPLDPNPWL